MDSYTIVNMLEIDDVTSGRMPGLEGRFARAQLDSRDLGVSHWRYAPNLKSAMGHRHGQQEEAYIVVAGGGWALLDGEVRELRQWDVVRVAPPVVRAFAAGPDGMEMIAIGGPKPETADGEMLEVVWPS
jgi:quercetin dioxygenase-like cupin family protein